MSSTSTGTWMGGPTTRDQKGVLGTLGLADVSNRPGSRNHAASWIDSIGNLWLFGRYGYDTDGNGDNLNDLWKYHFPQ